MTRTSFYLLALLSGLIIAQRFHTYQEPFHGDITYYALMGHELRQGGKLYSELIDHKPPAIYVSYEMAEYVVGYGPRSVLFLNILVAIATLLGIYLAVLAGSSSSSAAGWAALFWTLVCGDLTLEANQPNAEVFLNACLVWAFALMIQPQEKPWRLRRTLGIGFLFALATLYWQPALIIAVALILTYALIQKNTVRPLQIAGIGLGVWACVGGYFAAMHRWKPFYALMFTFNRFYAGQHATTLQNLLLSLHPDPLPTDLGPILPLFVVSVLLILTGFILTSKKQRVFPGFLLATYLAASHVAIALPGKFFTHYYQLWIPPLIVGVGWALNILGQRFSKQVILVTGICLAGLIAIHEAPFYQLSADAWSVKEYGYEFILTKKTGQDLGQILQPNESFYVWGTQEGLYYWSHHRPPTGAFYGYFLMTGPFANALTQQVLMDLQHSLPDLFVSIHWVWPGQELYESNPVYEWGRTYYRRFEWDGHRGSFIFAARRGSALEKRIENHLEPAHFIQP